MVVTLDAAEGLREEGLPSDVNEIIKVDLSGLITLYHCVIPRPQSQETSGDDPFRFLLVVLTVDLRIMNFILREVEPLRK